MKILKNRKGVALIITLSLMVILTVVIIGFATTSRTERQASRIFDREMAAQQMAQMGVARVLATLRAATPLQLGGTRIFASGPGMVTSLNNSITITTTGILYSTGTISVLPGSTLTAVGSLGRFATVSAAGSGGLVNINQLDVGNTAQSGSGMGAPIVPINNFYTVSGGAATTSVNVVWIPIYNPSNPGELIGRFAYWTDDNSARINVNTAYLRSNPGLVAGTVINTSSVSLLHSSEPGGLQSITSAMASNIYLSASKPFATTEQIKFTGISSATFEFNKFYFTNFGTDTEVDIFGRSRLNFNLLTATSTSDVNTALYARLLSTGIGDWKILYPYSDTKILGIIPVGRPSLAEKFVMNGRQLMANMVDFTKARGTDSTHSPIQAGPFDVSGNPFAYLPVQTSGNLGYLGVKKSPYLNEAIVKVGVAASGGFLDYHRQLFAELQIELINPYEVPLGNGYQLYYNIQLQAFTYDGEGNNFNGDGSPYPAHEGTIALSDIPAKSYFVVTIPLSEADETFPTFGDPGTQLIRANINQLRLSANTGSGSIRDYYARVTNLILTSAPGDMEWSENYPSGTPYDMNTYSGPVTFAPARSIAKDDPRVPRLWLATPLSFDISFLGIPIGLGITMGNWTVTPGAQNSAAFSYASVVNATDPLTQSLLLPLYDVDSNFSLFGTYWYLSPDSPEGGNVMSNSGFIIAENPISSLGTLGFIHTGTPWRTLRFQPQPQRLLNGSPDEYGTDSTMILGANDWRPSCPPDYAIMDLLKLTGTDAATLSATGKININSMLMDATIFPANSGSTAALIRRAPLIAALGTATGILNSASMADAIAHGSGVILPAQRLRVFAGEVCETPQLKNAVTTGANPTDAQAEFVIREIAPLITTRSNSFTVWSMGQSIKEYGAPNGLFDGNDVVTGQSLIQAVIERDPVTNTYRVIYVKHLNE